MAIKFVGPLLFCVAVMQAATVWAVPDEIYVDPAVTDGTGAGTSGSPYGNLQYALDQCNHGGDGARFNVKSGTAEDIPTGGYSLDTHFGTNGAPGPTEPIIIQGYTSTAGDGGIAEFNGTTNSAAFWVDTTTGGADIDNAAFIDLKITTAQATGYSVNIDNFVLFLRVELISNHGGIDIDSGTIEQCKLTYVDNKGISGNSSVRISNSYFVQSSGALVAGAGGGCVVVGNIFNVRGATDGNGGVIDGFSTESCVVVGNTVIANLSGAGTSNANGIRVNAPACIIRNNYVEGFNSVNDEAIEVVSSSNFSVLANNAFYGNAANISDAGISTITIGSTSSLSASGVTNAASADFTPTSDLKGTGYPTGFLQLSGNATDPNIGAIETSSGSTNVIDPLTGTIPGL